MVGDSFHVSIQTRRWKTFDMDNQEYHPGAGSRGVKEVCRNAVGQYPAWWAELLEYSTWDSHESQALTHSLHNQR